ncbi:unnamed protein product [Boreogadus saida]
MSTRRRDSFLVLNVPAGHSQLPSGDLWCGNNTFVDFKGQSFNTIQQFVQQTIEEKRTEVRDMAGTTLSGLLQCQFFPLDQGLQSRLQTLSQTRLSRTRGEPASTELVRRHAGVLGLSALVLSSPYGVPHWMPQVLMELSDHLNDPQPIEMTVKKTLSEFRRTHHDNWQQHRQRFTDDQLLVLTNLLVSPCYYA